MKRFIIYQATNIFNGKKYIGRTEFSLEERRKEHIKWSKQENPKYVFHRAIKKHGYENFHWCILDKSAKDLKELKELEIKYINEFKTVMPNGYNMDHGGGGPIPKGATKENNALVARFAEKRKGRTKQNHPGTARQAEKLTGRTKDKDPIVAKMAEKLRGRTKETHVYLANMADKQRGKTKANNPGTARMAEKMRGRTKENNEGVRLAAEKRKGFNHTSEAKEKIGRASKGQNNPMSRTNIEKRKFKKENPELFSFNKEIPPILSINYCTNKPEVNNIS